MPSERQLIQGTIASLEATVKFHEKRGEDGEHAAATAAVLLQRERERLAALRRRPVTTTGD